MNQHRLYRKSKRIQGKGFFKSKKVDLNEKAVVDKLTDADILKEIFSKKMKGTGLKILPK